MPLGIHCECFGWVRTYGVGRPGEEHHRDCRHWCERVGEAYCDAMGCGTFSHVMFRMPLEGLK